MQETPPDRRFIVIHVLGLIDGLTEMVQHIPKLMYKKTIAILSCYALEVLFFGSMQNEQFFVCHTCKCVDCR